ANQLTIGGDSIYGQYFNGLIDNVRIYNTALTQTQIQTDMTTPLGGGSTDTTPPTAPATLSGSAVSGSQINLSWGVATDNVGVTGYQVERCQGAGCSSFAQVGTPSGTTFNDTGLSANTSYSYRVRAVDAAGNTGPYSNTFTVSTQAPDTQAPSAPGTLTATANGAGQINLSWGAATDNVGVTGYQVFRCQGGGCSNFSQIATPTTTSYSNSGLNAATSYSYQVRAVDAAANQGPFTNTATATTAAASSGLVAAYSFDAGSGSTLTDLSGTGNTGTIANATWSSQGKYGGALSFNGTNARVNVANAASLQLSSGMTLEAWVDPATVSSTWRDVIYKSDDNYYLMGTTDHSGAPAGGGTFGGANANAFATAALPTNTWSFLAATYDGTNLRLYLNGTQVATVAKTGNILSSANQLTIGGDSIYGQYFNGLIDNVRIYNTALTQTQIQTDMTTPLGGGGSTDTTPPTAPGTLTATANGAGGIDLSWGAATDNVAVTGYHIERCQGGGCTSFGEIANSTTTSYSDTTAAAQSYTYRVRANDGATNLGPYSNTATATTAGLQIVFQGTDANGVASYSVTSADNGYGTQVLRVLAPTHPAPGVPHNFMFVLPVEAGTATVYGDGLETLRSLDAEDQYNLTIVEPSFGTEPWYADNPNDVNLHYETFMSNDLVPWVRQHLATTGIEQNWLIGFSKSGIGGQDLILKHPDLFTLAASWDFPADASAYDQFGSSSASQYGTDANFQANY
ncbi:MAG TPA: LamG-like jellyroll fold domain-containing protein, partial [Mycobacterium sp.]|nr:LamG-like jellyroll fold domain-containing protein [Mycobacterium sp.]